MSKRQLEKIVSQLAAQEIAQEAVESSRQAAESARLREAGHAYERRVESSASAGESARSQVIQPWWEGLESSGLATQLAAILRQGLGNRATVGSTITSPSPDGRGYNVRLWLEAKQAGIRPVFTRFIPGARGMASGYKHKSLEVGVDFARPEGELSNIHPGVLVELARQIEEGEVEEGLVEWLGQLR